MSASIADRAVFTGNRMPYPGRKESERLCLRPLQPQLAASQVPHGWFKSGDTSTAIGKPSIDYIQFVDCIINYESVQQQCISENSLSSKY